MKFINLFEIFADPFESRVGNSLFGGNLVLGEAEFGLPIPQ